MKETYVDIYNIIILKWQYKAITIKTQRGFKYKNDGKIYGIKGDFI